MLNRRPSQIRRQLGKSQVEIIFCPVLFRLMHQMLRRAKTFLNVVNLWKFFPAFRIYLNQITDSRAINPQGMANRNILFFYFYAITGCNLHTIISLSFLFWISVFCCFRFPFGFRYKPVPAPCFDHWPSLHNRMDSTNDRPTVPVLIPDEQGTSALPDSPS